jgi:hypothetical protein
VRIWIHAKSWPISSLPSDHQRCRGDDERIRLARVDWVTPLTPRFLIAVIGIGPFIGGASFATARYPWRSSAQNEASAPRLDLGRVFCRGRPMAVVGRGEGDV